MSLLNTITESMKFGYDNLPSFAQNSVKKIALKTAWRDMVAGNASAGSKRFRQ